MLKNLEHLLEVSGIMAYHPFKFDKAFTPRQITGKDDRHIGSMAAHYTKLVCAVLNALPDLIIAARAGERIAELRTEEGVEALALAILNSDRTMRGFAAQLSRDTIPDSDGYVINARAVIAHILGEG